MKKTSYYEQLKDPRWQRRRLEILEAAEFRCQFCLDSESTLHVHHLIYEKGKAPWEYEDRFLICLCAECHETWHLFKTTIDRVIAGLDFVGMSRVLAYTFCVSGESALTLDKGMQKLTECFFDPDWPLETGPMKATTKGILDCVGNDAMDLFEDGVLDKGTIFSHYMERIGRNKNEG